MAKSKTKGSVGVRIVGRISTSEGRASRALKVSPSQLSKSIQRVNKEFRPREK